MKHFVRYALPLPCLYAVLLLCSAFTDRMDTLSVANGLLVIAGLLALLICIFRY